MSIKTVFRLTQISVNLGVILRQQNIDVVLVLTAASVLLDGDQLSFLQ